MWLYVYQLLLLLIACKNTVACWAQHVGAATVALSSPHMLKVDLNLVPQQPEQLQMYTAVV